MGDLIKSLFKVNEYGVGDCAVVVSFCEAIHDSKHVGDAGSAWKETMLGWREDAIRTEMCQNGLFQDTFEDLARNAGEGDGTVTDR